MRRAYQRRNQGHDPQHSERIQTRGRKVHQVRRALKTPRDLREGLLTVETAAGIGKELPSSAEEGKADAVAAAGVVLVNKIILLISTTPSARAKVASQLFLCRAATAPRLRRGVRLIYLTYLRSP